MSESQKLDILNYINFERNIFDCEDIGNYSSLFYPD